MNKVVQSRLKSFAWRTAMMVAVAGCAFAVDNAAELNLPSWSVVLVGLVAGEVSKYLNRK
jgi:hypothetical protein